MNFLSKVNQKVIRVIEVLLAMLLATAILFILAQVFYRYALHNPLDWTEQSSRFLFIWMMTLGTSVVMYRNDAMAFDLLLHGMKPTPRKWTELFIILLIIFFTCYYGYQGLYLAVQVKGRFTSGVRIPLSFMYSSMFVSNVLVLMVMIEKLMVHIITMAKGN